MLSFMSTAGRRRSIIIGNFRNSHINGRRCLSCVESLCNPTTTSIRARLTNEERRQQQQKRQLSVWTIANKPIFSSFNTISDDTSRIHYRLMNDHYRFDQRHHSLGLWFSSKSSSSSSSASSSLRRQFRQLMKKYQVENDHDEENRDLFSEERRLRRKLLFVTRRILERNNNTINNNDSNDNDPDLPPLPMMNNDGNDQQQQQQQQYDQDIALAIRMWLAIYDDKAMEQAWTLLEHYLQQQQTLSPLMTASSLLSSSTIATVTKKEDTSIQNDFLNLVLFNWKARWISQEAYWQTPNVLFDKLQAMVKMRISHDGTMANANPSNLVIPSLTAFHTLLQAVARGIIAQQAQQKKQGISLLQPPPAFPNPQSSSSSSPVKESNHHHHQQQQQMSSQEAVDLAEQVLAFLQSTKLSSYHGALLPTTLTYNLVMDIWSRSNLPHAPERVEELLQFLRQLHHHHQQQQTSLELLHEDDSHHHDHVQPFLKPSTGSYRAAITAWAHHHHHHYHHQQRHQQEYHPEQPTPAERAWKLLKEMMEEYQATNVAYAESQESTTLRSTRKNADDRRIASTTFNTDATKDAWLENGDAVDDDDIDMTLRHHSSVAVKPIGECFSLVIWAFATEGKASQAQTVFQEQCRLFQSTRDLDFCPTVFGMNSLIQAWAESPMMPSPTANAPAIEQISTSKDQPHTIPGIVAEQLISQMEILAEQTGNAKRLPNIHTYRTALKAWVKSCAIPNQQQLQQLQQQEGAATFPEAPLRAEAMLRRMEFYHQSGLLDESPGIASYGMVVDAWCKAGDPERAEVLLMYLQSQWQEQDSPEMKPTRIHYHIVLNAWGKSTLPDAPQRATRLLEEMKRADDDDVQPDSVTYFLILNMWAKSQTKEGQTMVQKILKEMQARGVEGTVSVSSNLSANSQSRQTQTSGLHPSTLHYNTVLNSMAKAGEAEAAEGLLRQGRTIGVENGELFEPDVCSYNTVLQAWSKSRRPDAPIRAQALFDELMRKYEKGSDDRLKPTVETFTTIINIHGNSKHPQSVDRALGLFQDMKSRFQAGAKHLKPDVIFYTAMLNAFSKAGEAERAEAFLDQMIKLSLQTDSNEDDEETSIVIPNTRSFATVIAAWANSNDPQAGRRAERVLRRMQQLSYDDVLQQSSVSFPCRPDTVSYNCTLQAWKKSLLLCRQSQYQRETQKRRASKHSQNTPETIIGHMEMLLMEMIERSLALGDSSVIPDRLSFLSYLTALQRCSPNVVVDRRERAQCVLDWSKQIGLIPDDDLIRRVRQCTDAGGE